MWAAQKVSLIASSRSSTSQRRVHNQSILFSQYTVHYGQRPSSPLGAIICRPQILVMIRDKTGSFILLLFCPQKEVVLSVVSCFFRPLFWVLFVFFFFSIVITTITHVQSDFGDRIEVPAPLQKQGVLGTRTDPNPKSLTRQGLSSCSGGLPRHSQRASPVWNTTVRLFA